MTKPSVILTHPTGNANVRAALMGLNSAGYLKEFHTGIACFEGTLMDSLSNFGPLKELKRRGFDSQIKSITYTHPYREIGRLLAGKASLKSLLKHETGVFSVDAVYQNIDKAVASRILNRGKKIANAVYAYEDGAESIFEAASQVGLKRLYDLPIGYWRAARHYLESERDARPDWAMTLTGFNDSEKKLNRKDREIFLSDEIFVASSFTKKTLEHYPGELNEIHVVPYGFPDTGLQRSYRIPDKGPLKVLFVGGLSQRKGIANLFEAAKALGKSIDLTIVGSKSSAECKALDAALETCKWIPSLPHNEILKLMRDMDLLAFPSLFEGFGLVITEAMSQGTPVITTDRTAGPDVITPGKDGWIIEAGSTEALTECLNDIIKHQEILESYGKEAMKTAAKRPWNVYGTELAERINGCFVNEGKSILNG